MVNNMQVLLRLLRTSHYVKNIFIFAPLFFSFHYTYDGFVKTLIIFCLFSLLASSIYIINDLCDITEDKKHPQKKFRPIANGEVSQFIAKLLVVALSMISLLGALILDQNLFFIMLFYFLLNILYSISLKHIAIIDIFVISLGFILRLFAGCVVINVELSSWIVIITFLLTLFLAIAKRRSDVLLYDEGKNVRKNLDGYNLEFINASMVLMATAIIISYILYTVSPEVQARLDTNYLYVTSFFVLLGILKYLQITVVEEKSSDPVKLLLKNRFLQVVILLWLISFYLCVKV